ncbi:MAG: BACON domain-containing protein [Clostridia bacterium]|nr:BACON domain-containing protein [Clostridia bacterium]
MADLWVHDYNDAYGVHFGIDSSIWKDKPNGNPFVDDHNTAQFAYKDSTGQYISKINGYKFEYDINPFIYPHEDRGETFNEAKFRYEMSPFITQGLDGDHQHPIIAVFWGSKYIWPTRNIRNAENKVTYVFQDYSNDDRGTMTPSNRNKSINKEGGNFTIYLDTHNTVRLYKCNYYFKVESSVGKSWIHIENGTPAKNAQNILNNKDKTIVRDGNPYEGCVWWDYSINNTNNELIGVQLKENANADSTLKVTVEPNKSVYPRTGIITLCNQYDQYKGVYVGKTQGNGTETIVYTINQPADNIRFTDFKFYNNDNTSASIYTGCYGPMISVGGRGWIYFKITGDSTLGANRVFGEFPCQDSSKITITDTANIVSIGEPTYNPGTGIWTASVDFPSNANSGSSIFNGNVSVTANPQKASYEEGSKIQLIAGGITSSISAGSGIRTAYINVSISSSLTGDDPKYVGTPSGTICYTQNGKSAGKPQTPTYKYEVVGNANNWLSVSQTGTITFKANNTGVERCATIKVTCNENSKYTTITVCQAATSYNFGDDGAYIKFYEDAAGTKETTNYGPVSGTEESTQTIYFKVFGKNGNGDFKELDDVSKITSIYSNTCYPQISSDNNTLKYNGSTFSCDVKFNSNNGSTNKISGNLDATATIAEYKAGSKSKIFVSGLRIDNSGNIYPEAKTHKVTVQVDGKLESSCNIRQNAGIISSDNITTISYLFTVGGDSLSWITRPYPTNELRELIWTENTSDTIRGGSREDVSVTITCEQDPSYSITIYPKQYCDNSQFFPVEAKITDIEWTILEFYDYLFENTIVEIPVNSTNKMQYNYQNENGGSITETFKIKGKVTFDDGTFSEVYYGASSSIVTPTSLLNISVIENTSVSVSTSSISGSGDYTVNINYGATSSTTEQQIATIKFTVKSGTSNGITWPTTTFNVDGKDIVIYQAPYSGGTTTETTYYAYLDTIELSLTNNINDFYTFNGSTPVTFNIPQGAIIDKVYFRVKIAVEVRENGTTVKTDYQYMTKDASNIVSEDEIRNNAHFTTIGKDPSSETIYYANVNGTDSTFDTTFSIRIPAHQISYNGELLYDSINGKKFESCGRIYRTEIVDNSIDWKNITFYKSSDCTTPISRLDVDADASTYVIWFKITGENKSGVSQTYNGNASGISLKELLEDGTNLTATCTKVSGATGVYKLERSIPNVTTDNKYSDISCSSCDGDLNVTGLLEIWKKATVVVQCSLNLYSPTSTESGFAYSSNIYNKLYGGRYGVISDNSIVATTSDVSGKIYIYSTETPTVKQGTTNISIQQVSGKDNYYSFDLEANTSKTGSAIYTVSNGCSTESIKISIPAKNVVITYKTVWKKLIWGPDLTDTSIYDVSNEVSYFDSVDRDFKVRFRVVGERTQYADGVAVQDSTTTVYLNDINYIVSNIDILTNHTHLLSKDIHLVSGQNSTFYIEGANSGKVPAHISHTSDTSNIQCYIIINIAGGNSSDFGIWSTATSTNLSNYTFTYNQLGNTWDPYIEY